jgi:D-glycero-D-manno-heptose 1,7-bisphosphate phosphatase
MLLRAAADLNLDLDNSWIVGDKLSDLEAGVVIGVRPILVRTGHGAGEEAYVPPHTPVVDSILEAASYIESHASINLDKDGLQSTLYK